jgi:phosphatidate cytidylyltransferase
MIQRVISGILGAVMLIGLICAGDIYFTLAIGLLVTLAVLEYAELLKRQNFRPQTGVMIFISLLLLVFIQVTAKYRGLDPMESFRICERFLTLMLMVVFFMMSIIELFRGNPDQGLINVAANLFGTVYIGFMFAYILLLRFIPGPDGLIYVLFAALVTWANDSAAYFVGVNFGRHKLCPRISPKKSIEGSVGGLIGGLVGAALIGLIFKKPLWIMLVLGVLVVAAGQFGDLIESIIKRNAGVKDSGSFLPGHGGVLDRFDSLLLAGPVVYYVVTYILPYCG